MKKYRRAHIVRLGLPMLLAPVLLAQTPSPTSRGEGSFDGPIAIVPLTTKPNATGPTVTGALQVTAGKAVIGASGQVTSASQPTSVLLPRRGSLRVCQSTTVRLTGASSSSANSQPGLMIALDHGALELSFASASTSDILLTPDFRIQLGGGGKADLDARIADHGDTCIDNRDPAGPFVLVTSVFDGSTYNIRPGQRVMFHHGSVHEVSDMEKEPCGCPPTPTPGKGNDFPLAQSEGLEPTPAPKASPVVAGATKTITTPLVFNAPQPSIQNAATPEPASSATAPKKSSLSQKDSAKKGGFFHRLGHFFRAVFHA